MADGYHHADESSQVKQMQNILIVMITRKKDGYVDPHFLLLSAPAFISKYAGGTPYDA